MATAAQRITNLTTILDAEIANLDALVAAGPQAWVDYSADGESYQYNAAKTAHEKRIEDLNVFIQKLSPFCIRSRVST